jgi:drug/metabolite transporter (DMT)-like permease
VVAPITAVTSAVIPVAVGLLEGERPSTLAYFGMALAVAAVALVSGAIGQRHTVTKNSTIVYALIAGVGFAMIFISLSKTSEDSGIWPLVGARVVSISIIAFAVLASRTSLSGRGSVWRLAAVAGLLDTSANFMYLLAVRRGLLSVVVVVVALYPVSTVCLAFGLDRERVSKSQAVGMALALGSLVLVSVSGAS